MIYGQFLGILALCNEYGASLMCEMDAHTASFTNL
jgi:hypothetical protein